MVKAGAAAVTEIRQVAQVLRGKREPQLHRREHRAMALAIPARVADDHQPLGFFDEISRGHERTLTPTGWHTRASPHLPRLCVEFWPLGARNFPQSHLDAAIERRGATIAAWHPAIRPNTVPIVIPRPPRYPSASSFPAMISPSAKRFAEGAPSAMRIRARSSTPTPRYVNVMPGRSGYPRNGGRSIGTAQ